MFVSFPLLESVLLVSCVLAFDVLVLLRRIAWMRRYPVLSWTKTYRFKRGDNGETCKELVVVSLTHQFCYTVALKIRFPDVQQVALSRVSR